jgi:hypothetical protein
VAAVVIKNGSKEIWKSIWPDNPLCDRLRQFRTGLVCALKVLEKPRNIMEMSL